MIIHFNKQCAWFQCSDNNVYRIWTIFLTQATSSIQLHSIFVCHMHSSSQSQSQFVSRVWVVQKPSQNIASFGVHDSKMNHLFLSKRSNQLSCVLIAFKTNDSEYKHSYRSFCAFTAEFAATLKSRRLCAFYISCKHFPWTATISQCNDTHWFHSLSACADCKRTHHFPVVLTHSLAVSLMQCGTFNSMRNCASNQKWEANWKHHYFLSALHVVHEFRTEKFPRFH